MIRKIKILDQFHCELSNKKNAIKVSDEILHQIGITKCFDIENNLVVDYDNTKDLKKQKVIEQIKELKSLLSSTDYRAIKYAEGCYTEEEYKPYKELRQEYRNKINELEKEL